jgi:hypothetical protein
MESKECMDFNNEDPLVDDYMIMFKKEFTLVIQEAKERLVNDMKTWLQNLAY